MNVILMLIGLGIGAGLAYYVRGPALTVGYVIALVFLLLVFNEVQSLSRAVTILLVYIYSIPAAIIATLVVNGTYQSAKERFLVRTTDVINALKIKNLKEFAEEYVLRDRRMPK